MDEPTITDRIQVVDGIKFIMNMEVGLYASVLKIDIENTFQGKKIVVKKVM